MNGGPPRPQRRLPQRSHARSNRARILAVARQELGRDPDASLDAIARSAGVVRRTLYGHFPNREALISALAEEAKEALGEALAAARQPGADPATALARLVLATWAVGDRHRMLISLARRDLGEDRVRAALAPARAAATAILERGQREGVFADHLPAAVLALAAESIGLAILESQAPGNQAGQPGQPGEPARPGQRVPGGGRGPGGPGPSGRDAPGWSDPTGRATATAVLLAAGVAPAAARRCVSAVPLADVTPDARVAIRR